MKALVVFTVVAVPCAAIGQETRFNYPAPPPGQVLLVRDVEYGATTAGKRLMDIYRAQPPASRSTVPVFIIFNTVAGSRTLPWSTGWGRAAAGNGFVGIVPDIDTADAAQDLNRLLAYLMHHAGELGVDPGAVGLFAASSIVQVALPLVENPKRTDIHAAVMFYGTAPVRVFRPDLPLLYVRAGLDRPDVNRAITELATAAIAQNAPVTFLNHSWGHHAFELNDNDEGTRELIDAVFEFVRRATTPGYQAAGRTARREVTAAGAFMTRNYGLAVRIFGELVAEDPANARLRLSLGEALLANQQYADACKQFDQLRGSTLGRRDLGVPAARACALNGDAPAAIAWLTIIPKQFLPTDLERDSAFSAIRDRPDFRALFRP